VKQLRGPQTIPEDHRLLSPSERMSYHCSRVLSENWNRFPCDQEAVKIYELPDGSRVGWCFKHLEEGKKHAEFRGWKVAA
jgi:hypothetical protein